MPSLASCVAGALDADKITQETADKLRSELGDFDAEEVVKAALSENYLKRRQQTIQVIKTLEALEKANSHPKGLRAGILALIVKDKYSQVGYENIDTQYKALLGYYDSMMTDLLYKHKRKFAGWAQGESMDDIVRAVYGERVTDVQAKQFADDLSQVIEQTRVDFNKAGGAIRKLNKYLPQTHSAKRMLNNVKGDPDASKQAWIDFISTRIEKLKDENGVELNDADQLKTLSNIYDTITTDGLANIKRGEFKGTGKLANKNQASRILHFKDADSWLSYHREFGNNDIYSTMTDFTENMARDTAALEVLGANPTLTFNYLVDALKQQQGNNNGIQYLRDTFAVQTGMNNFEQVTALAEGFTEGRALMSAAMLGGAMLSSFGDTVLLAMTARYNGMPAMRALKRGLKMFTSLDDADQIAGARMGLVANAVKSDNLAANRFLSGTGKMGTGFGSKANESVMRMSWLNRWTESIRLAFSMEYTSFIAEQLQLPRDQMTGNLKRTLNRYGFSDQDLDDLANIEPYKQEGVSFLTADSILNSGLPEEQARRLQRKYMGMLLQEAEYAALTPDASTRSIFGAEQRGTWKGELMISTGMFKSFPVTMLNTHIMRALNESSKMGKAAYAAQLVLGTAVVASLGLQAKELAAGREPRPMDDWRFFAQSIMLGGGLGIFGDFLFADHNRFGHTSGLTLGGALLGIGQDTAGLLQTAVTAPLSEDVTWRDFSSQFLNYAQRINFLDTWQTRLLMERLLFQQLQVAVDPKAKKRFARQARKQAKDYGNDYYWQKGEPLPEGL